MNNQRTAVAIMDIDHDCKIGAEHGCTVCQSRAEFYRISNEKWSRLQAKFAAVRRRMNGRYMPDCAVVAAILTPSDEKQEEICKQ